MDQHNRKKQQKISPYLASGMMDVDSPYFIQHWQDIQFEGTESSPSIRLPTHTLLPVHATSTIQIHFRSRHDPSR
ncbi:hypothetical protein [Risungbinella massiliensis]|uniref:hypothetical protein n=1 Tax=Risungbinella massiliensis TaxID=1329796 RepID=UPI0005CBEC90|nr:hypothetical protein [Risungbinella massiliensis]